MSAGRVLVITGTDTGVGKTVATAALAARLLTEGQSVAVYKPTQAGLEDGVGDTDVVRRLTGIESVFEGIRLQYPMAPVAAAAREGVELPPLREHRRAVERLRAAYDVTLVEGAGGLLVALDQAGGTLADLGPADSAFLVVCRAALGTLNHTALTLAALGQRSLSVGGLIIGAWPADPGDIELDNRAVFESANPPLLGAIPAGAGQLSPAAFVAGAPSWIRLEPTRG